MKKAVFVLTAIMLSFSVFAHPGKTDANGGHYSRANGIYHYHHGYEGHYHTDGVCPYDFDDKTDHSNHGSSGGSNAIGAPFVPKPIETPVEKDDPVKEAEPQTSIVHQTDEEDNEVSPALVLLCLIGIIALWSIIGMIIESISDFFQKKRTRKYKSPQITIHENIIPKGVELNENLLPEVIGEKYSERFYIAFTYNGKCYHKKSCKSLEKSRHCYTEHKYNNRTLRSPCRYCNPTIKQEEWYADLRTAVINDKTKYNDYVKRIYPPHVYKITSVDYTSKYHHYFEKYHCNPYRKQQQSGKDCNEHKRNNQNRKEIQKKDRRNADI